MYRTVYHGIVTSDSHQLAISMSVHPCAFLEATLRCEERAVQNRSHREHAAHDGTCSGRGIVRSQSRQEKKTYRTMLKSAQKIDAVHDGQREWVRLHNQR